MRHRRDSFEDETARLSNSMAKKPAEQKVAAINRNIHHFQRLYHFIRSYSLVR
jgi:hypothetical protein